MSQCAAALEPGPHEEECSLLLNDLCCGLMAPPPPGAPPPPFGHSSRLTHLMFHDVAGPMILEAAQGGLPHDHAIAVSFGA